MALLFASEGAAVVVNDIDAESRAGGRRRKSRAMPPSYRATSSSDAAMQELFQAVRETHGRLDVSVHDAGIMHPQDAGVVETPLEVWDRAVAVDLTGVFLCCTPTRSP